MFETKQRDSCSKLNKGISFSCQVALACGWCFRVYRLLLSGIPGLTWTEYVNLLGNSKDNLDLHQACAMKLVEQAIANKDKQRHHVDWDDVEETLIKEQTSLIRETATKGRHYDWKSYSETFPEGLQAHVGDGHIEYQTQAGVDGVFVPDKSGVTDITCENIDSVKMQSAVGSSLYMTLNQMRAKQQAII